MGPWSPQLVTSPIWFVGEAEERHLIPPPLANGHPVDRLVLSGLLLKSLHGDHDVVGPLNMQHLPPRPAVGTTAEAYIPAYAGQVTNSRSPNSLHWRRGGTGPE